MSKRVLITGAAGFFGSYMCKYLASLAEPPTLIGTDIIPCNTDGWDHFYKMDLSSSDEVGELIERCTPDYLIHLAGTFGTDDTQEIYRVNVLSITALLEAVRKHTPDVVMVAAGSAAEYGPIEPHQLPVDEQTPCQPVNPYGLSKQLATQVALYYHRVHQIDVMIIRPFQLLGKGVTSRLAPGAFAQQLKQIIAQGSGIIKVGNLESSRDFLDIDDAVDAVWLLCQKPSPGQIFNLCSGKPTKMADLLATMIKHCGVEVKIETDPARLRGKDDVSQIYGSSNQLNSHSGWIPQTSLEDSVAEMLR